MGLPGNGGIQILGGGADRFAGGGVANLLEKFEMTMSMAGLAFGGGTEYGGRVVIALHVRLLGEIQIAAVCLRFASKGGFQIFLGFRAFQAHRVVLLSIMVLIARQGVETMPFLLRVAFFMHPTGGCVNLRIILNTPLSNNNGLFN